MALGAPVRSERESIKRFMRSQQLVRSGMRFGFDVFDLDQTQSFLPGRTVADVLAFLFPERR